jgi:hypothetical protein
VEERYFNPNMKYQTEAASHDRVGHEEVGQARDQSVFRKCLDAVLKHTPSEALPPLSPVRRKVYCQVDPAVKLGEPDRVQLFRRLPLSEAITEGLKDVQEHSLRVSALAERKGKSADKGYHNLMLKACDPPVPACAAKHRPIEENIFSPQEVRATDFRRLATVKDFSKTSAEFHFSRLRHIDALSRANLSMTSSQDWGVGALSRLADKISTAVSNLPEDIRLEPEGLELDELVTNLQHVTAFIAHTCSDLTQGVCAAAGAATMLRRDGVLQHVSSQLSTSSARRLRASTLQGPDLFEAPVLAHALEDFEQETVKTSQSRLLGDVHKIAKNSDKQSSKKGSQQSGPPRKKRKPGQGQAQYAQSDQAAASHHPEKPKNKGPNFRGGKSFRGGRGRGGKSHSNQGR